MNIQQLSDDLIQSYLNVEKAQQNLYNAKKELEENLKLITSELFKNTTSYPEGKYIIQSSDNKIMVIEIDVENGKIVDYEMIESLADFVEKNKNAEVK